MSNKQTNQETSKENKEKSNNSYFWLYPLVGLLIFKFIFPTVANIMKNEQNNRQLKLQQQIDTIRRQNQN